MHVTRETQFVAVSVLVVLILVMSYMAYHRRIDTTGLIGLNQNQLLDELGEPTQTFDGLFGNPTVAHAQQYGEVRTQVYDRYGGSLYVALESRNGGWFVVEADYLPDGVEW